MSALVLLLMTAVAGDVFSTVSKQRHLHANTCVENDRDDDGGLL